MEHTYSCDVYNAKIKQWDCYWVNAKTPEEAYLTCRDRLDNETDNPEDWEVKRFSKPLDFEEKESFHSTNIRIKVG